MYLKEKILCRDTLAHIDVLENILHSLGSGVVQSLLQDENNSTWTYEWNVHFIQQLHALLRGVDLAGILISDGLDNRLSSSSGSLGLRMKRNTKKIPSEHAPNLSETEPWRRPCSSRQSSRPREIDDAEPDTLHTKAATTEGWGSKSISTLWRKVKTEAFLV